MPTPGATEDHAVEATAGSAAGAVSSEEAYWRAKHPSQPYATGGRSYEEFAEGYRTGYRGYRPGVSFAEREEELRAEYEREHPAEVPGTMQHAMSTRPLQECGPPADAPESMQHAMSTRPLRWAEARPAAQAAYERMAQTPQIP